MKEILENGGENGMIEESEIAISHSTRLVSFFLFASLFKLQLFSPIISLFFFFFNYYFELALVIR